MTSDPTGILLPVPAADAGAERMVFSLEMGRDGVRLRLAAARLDDLVAIRDLVLAVPYVRYPFDYTAGPRALQNHVTRLEKVRVDVHLPSLASRWRALTTGDRPAVRNVAGEGGGLVILGAVDHVPFTMRMKPRIGEAGLVVELSAPLAYGFPNLPGDRIGPALATPLPVTWLSMEVPQRIRLDLLRPLLLPLLARMGFKVPLVDGVGVTSVSVGRTGVSLEFGPARSDAGADGLAPAGGLLDRPVADPEVAAFEALAAMASAPREAQGQARERFVLAGLAARRLWPEVACRAMAFGTDSPENPLFHLAGLLVASRIPDAASAEDLALLMRRLVISLSGAGFDLPQAGQLLADLADRVSPLGLLDAAQVLHHCGVLSPDLLLAEALALDRTGMPEPARTLRRRALALASTGDAPCLLERAVHVLVRSGFDTAALSWLDEIIGIGETGEETAGIFRQALLSKAALLAMCPDGVEEARDVIRSLANRSPGDRDALNLLVALAATDAEVAEGIALLRSAADAVRGEERARLLARAAGLVADRLGLPHQAVGLLEAARESAPLLAGEEAQLEALYVRVGLGPRRLDLLRARLARKPRNPERIELLRDAARLSESGGDLLAAGGFLDELISLVPTDREALVSAARVFEAIGDAGALSRVRDALADLDARPSATIRPDPAVRQLLQAASTLAARGRSAEATDVLARAAALAPADPEILEVLKALPARDRARAMVHCLAESGRTAAGGAPEVRRGCAILLREGALHCRDVLAQPGCAMSLLELALGVDGGVPGGEEELAALYLASGNGTGPIPEPGEGG